MNRRIELQCATDEHGQPGVQFFVPADQMPELLDALELAADDGNHDTIDQLLVQLDRLIKRASDAGDDWATQLLTELEQAVDLSRDQLLRRAG